MTRTTTLVLATLLTLSLAGTATAQIKISESETSQLFMTLNTVGTLQALNQTNVFNTSGVAQKGPSTGFQNAFGDLGFIGKFGKHREIQVVFDMYLSSRNHPSTTYGNEGYLLMTGVPENLESLKFLTPVLSKVDIKAGQFLVEFGDGLHHRSNNAIVQKNPLIGNYVIDPNIVSIGLQVASKPGRFGWLVEGSNGTTTEDWNSDRGFAWNGKVYVYPIRPVRLSASYIATDQSKNPTKAAGGSSMQMFTGNRSGERYAGVLGGGQAPGNVFPQGGEHFSAAQFDMTFDDANVPIKLYGHYGLTREKDANGSAAGTPHEDWSYFAGEAVYRINKAIYAAARYSAATTSMLNGKTSNGNVHRIQVGGGLWLTKNLLAKVEYVDQKYDGFVTGEVVNNGIQAWRGPRFKGFVSEVSFAF